ncbi:hypothetical protein NQ314_016910 [Rhamnusium bicolor]|uniref:Gag-pol polyprotein n=1 Tax=Rhamnusium bicolor TaxID=1586634 RepID=A0AAV8WVU5_9CUCU|nr:hypothetical protein NQ314_016910 [Rhamnusium bicolor]
MSAEQEEKLMNNRKSTKGSVTRIQNFVLDFNAEFDDILEIKIRSEKLEELWIKFNNVQDQLEEIDFTRHESHRVDFEAWNLLNERYNNKEFIINSHIQALFELPHMFKDSCSSLRNLISEVKQHLRSLQCLGLPVNSWDAIITYLVKSKLDSACRREWELSKGQVYSETDPPNLDEFLKFLERRCFSLESTSGNQEKYKFESKPKVSHMAAEQQYDSCLLCKEKHKLWSCSKFFNQNQDEKLKTIKRLGVCFNCLRKNHSAAECRGSSCRKCGKKHHTLIHFDNMLQRNYDSNQISQPRQQFSPESQAAEPQVNLHNLTQPGEILLATAIIKVQDAAQHWHFCRALLDSASQIHSQYQGKKGVKDIWASYNEGKSRCSCSVN